MARKRGGRPTVSQNYAANCNRALFRCNIKGYGLYRIRVQKNGSASAAHGCGVVLEEIVAKRIGYAQKQFGVARWARENLVNVLPVAAYLPCQPRHAAPLRVQFPFDDMLSYVYRHKKSAKL